MSSADRVPDGADVPEPLPSPPDAVEAREEISDSAALHSGIPSTSSDDLGDHTPPRRPVDVNEATEPPRDNPASARPVEAEARSADLVRFPQDDDRQAALVGRDMTKAGVEPFKAGQHATEVFKLTWEDGSAAAYKPREGEFGSADQEPLRDSIDEGTYWNREVATYHVDRAAGFDLVPTTAPVESQEGIGSLQDWAPREPQVAGDYSVEDQQRMGVLDYVSGNTDRHIGNWMTAADGRPAAIDNGLTFPKTEDDPLRSDFFPAVLDKPLQPAVLEEVSRIDSSALAENLRADGIEDAAIKGCIDRLEEAKTGTIAGAAWGGSIVDGSWRVLR